MLQARAVRRNYSQETQIVHDPEQGTGCEIIMITYNQHHQNSHHRYQLHRTMEASSGEPEPSEPSLQWQVLELATYTLLLCGGVGTKSLGLEATRGSWHRY